MWNFYLVHMVWYVGDLLVSQFQPYEALHGCCFTVTWSIMLLIMAFFSSSSFVIFLQTAWIIVKGNAEYKPLQFLAFAFVYRIFEKLKAFEPPASPTYTVSSISCGTTCQDLVGIYVWGLLSYCFNLDIYKLFLPAGRWRRFRASTANGKTPASFSWTSFWLYCCFISGRIHYMSSIYLRLLVIGQNVKRLNLWILVIFSYFSPSDQGYLFIE